MFNKKYSKLLCCSCILVFLYSCILSVDFCLADGSLMESMSDCKDSGDCTLDDFVRIFTFYYTRVLGFIGSIALLVFIYGGVMFLISAGNSEKVQQAKQIIIGAVIGLVIVFASYAIIQFVFTALDIPGADKGQWATIGGWFK